MHTIPALGTMLGQIRRSN